MLSVRFSYGIGRLSNKPFEAVGKPAFIYDTAEKGILIHFSGWKLLMLLYSD
jgi:hypothetical protein